jgi:hypothetical protein
MDFASYFEREEVQSVGQQLRAARTTAHDKTVGAKDPLAAVAEQIALSSVAFTVKSSDITELVTSYFVGDGGIAELALVSGRTVATTHPRDTTVGSLLQRHMRDCPDMVLIIRTSVDGSRLHLALNRGTSAYSENGLAWRQGDQSHTAAEALEQFANI